MIFRSAARVPRSGSFPLRRAPVPAISRRRLRSRARARAYIRYYNLPPQSVNRFIPRAPARSPATIRPPLRAPPLTRDLCPCARLFRDAPASCGLPSLPTLWLLRACSAPRGHSRPRTRHKSRTPRHKNQFSNIALKSLFARRRREPATAAAAARLLGAMGREPDLRHGRDRRKQPKTTLENSHFYKTSLKSGFFESTILSKLPKSRVVLGDKGGQTAGDGRAEAFSFFV